MSNQQQPPITEAIHDLMLMAGYTPHIHEPLMKTYQKPSANALVRFETDPATGGVTFGYFNGKTMTVDWDVPPTEQDLFNIICISGAVDKVRVNNAQIRRNIDRAKHIPSVMTQNKVYANA